jgi:DNA polymerase
MDKTRLLFLDFETYFDSEYSLSKMPTPNYILDPRFECICCAVKEDMQRPTLIDGPDFPAFLAQYDPNHTVTVTFNALFDNSILAWRYGFVPRQMLDAMGMARALIGSKLQHGSSLKAVADYLKIGSKGTSLLKVKGMRRSEIMSDPHLWREFGDYAVQDVSLCAGIYDRLSPRFPAAERRVMDLVLRCCVEPRFQVDIPMLQAHLQAVKDAKSAMLAMSGATVGELMSTNKFTELLISLGISIQTKISPTGKTIPALAKTDEFMAELQEHPDMRVQALACARLGFKSTIEETRAEKLLSIAKLPWQNYLDGNPRLYSGGTMPIPLGYGKAHTHRLAGEWGMNMQNLPTERGSKGKSKLRKSLVAPPGQSVIVADLGQIEARLVAWICGERRLLQQFIDKLDPYALLATDIFGYKVDRKVQKLEGFIGKTGILGLGYGAGVDKFYNMVIIMARNAELDLGTTWTMNLAKKSVDTYRHKYNWIPHQWKALDWALSGPWLHKQMGPMKFGPCLISYGKVEGPGGLCLEYDEPRRELPGHELTYRYGKFVHKIYGAKFLENIVQFLARIIVMNAALRLRDRGLRFCLQAHDELVFIVPDEQLEASKAIIHEEMVRRPSWAPDLPLTADVGSGPSYGAAK